MKPKGLIYISEFLSIQEERSLLVSIGELPSEDWERTEMRGQVIKRRVLSFGWRYQLYKRLLVPAPQPPAFLRMLLDRCAKQVGMNASSFDQAVIMRYPPGAGIGLHTDARCFGPVVLGISLSACCRMVFRRRPTEVYERLLEERSLLILRDEARVSWGHEIMPVRNERLSILFRSRSAAPKRKLPI